MKDHSDMTLRELVECLGGRVTGYLAEETQEGSPLAGLFSMFAETYRDAFRS